METLAWADGLFDEDFPPNFSLGVDLGEPSNESDGFGVVPCNNTDMHYFNFDDEIDNFIRAGKAKQTSAKDNSDYRRFQIFLKDIAEPQQEIENIPAKKLDELLCRYFMTAKKFNKKTGKYDGEEYQPDSLSSFRNSMQRILSEKNSKFNLKKSKEFERSQKVLKSKRKNLTQ